MSTIWDWCVAVTAADARRVASASGTEVSLAVADGAGVAVEVAVVVGGISAVEEGAVTTDVDTAATLVLEGSGTTPSGLVVAVARDTPMIGAPTRFDESSPSPESVPIRNPTAAAVRSMMADKISARRRIERCYSPRALTFRHAPNNSGDSRERSVCRRSGIWVPSAQ